MRLRGRESWKQGFAGAAHAAACALALTSVSALAQDATVYSADDFATEGDLTIARAVVPQAPTPLDSVDPYPYRARQQSLRTVLSQFGRNLGVPVILTEAVEGTVTFTSTDLAPRDFLDRLAGDHGLEWYFDGRAIQVSRVEDSERRLFDLGHVPLAEVRATLAALGVIDDQFPLRGSDEHRLAVASGPSSYIETVERIVQALGGRLASDEPDTGPAQRRTPTVVRGPMR